ncbi:hypothetical protein [Paenibacillus hemerocallicola]|uniref:hypothetical protein n=1 Tax=Paenibacillus hemerocallicola TaxID=1172614 RepID=UPI00159ECCB1|nr:hypothetical protein [Paenibacillus hemerocallicola]
MIEENGGEEKKELREMIEEINELFEDSKIDKAGIIVNYQHIIGGDRLEAI